MIDLKITMANGKVHKIRNSYSENTDNFIRAVLTKNGTQLNWYEVVEDVFIQVSQIQSVEKLREIKEDEDEEKFKDGDEIVLPQNEDNTAASRISSLR